jgi:hypothetical protein
MIENGEGKSILQHWPVFVDINCVLQETIDK